MSNIYCEFCKSKHSDIHANFSFNYLIRSPNNWIVIIDKDMGGRSVTNDIEYVVWWLTHHIDISKYSFIYRDSMGIYDGIKVKDGKFLSFYPIREKDLYKALEFEYKLYLIYQSSIKPLIVGD